jgi:hypothetical protein
MAARVFDGSTSEPERRKIEREVNADKDHPASAHKAVVITPKTRILICTPVAGLGLNLHRTNLVINLVRDRKDRHEPSDLSSQSHGVNRHTSNVSGGTGERQLTQSDQYSMCGCSI